MFEISTSEFKTWHEAKEWFVDTLTDVKLDPDVRLRGATINWNGSCWWACIQTEKIK